MSCDCTEEKYNSIIVVSENKRKAKFRNPERKKYSVSTIDGCLIKDGVRADYLVTEEAEASVLVELKGADVSHACDQLFASAKNEKVKNLMRKSIGFLVVCSKYPRFDTFIARAKTKAARQYKAGFHVLCDQREVDIHEIVSINGRKK